MSYRDLLAQLLPPVAYSPDSKKLNAELTAEGNVFGTLENHAGQALDAVTPLFSHSLLADWERVLAITTIDGDSYQQRMQRVLAKLAETGGLSIPYFIRLASNLGYTITIDEPQPFRAGENRAGDRLVDTGHHLDLAGQYKEFGYTGLPLPCRQSRWQANA
jgi:uncharacterized protein YmfQ (DUF2313 family)